MTRTTRRSQPTHEAALEVMHLEPPCRHGSVASAAACPTWAPTKSGKEGDGAAKLPKARTRGAKCLVVARGVLVVPGWRCAARLVSSFA
jgi:hypothetical protein